MVSSGPKGIFQRPWRLRKLHLPWKPRSATRASSGQYFRTAFGPSFLKATRPRSTAHTAIRQTGSLYNFVMYSQPTNPMSGSQEVQAVNIIIKVNGEPRSFS